MQESITIFKEIISTYPHHDLAAEAQFQIADIYLNDVKDFEIAIEEFKEVIKDKKLYGKTSETCIAG